MSKSFEWKNTSLKINSQTDEGKLLIDNLNKEHISLRPESKIQILENQKEYYILEDEFINNSKNLLSIIMKYSEKKYEGTIRVYDREHHCFKYLKANSNDKNFYEDIVEENIIDSSEREFPISINTLKEVFNPNNKKSNLILDIFILISLANKSSFDAETFNFEFRFDDNIYRGSLHIDSNPLNLFEIYDWIINNEEYKESYSVKLQVVRQVIISKNNIKDVVNILEDSKLAYKRIISKKTIDYFEQLNQLKDDFLILSQNEKSTQRTLNLTFFAWLGTLGLELYHVIIDYNGQDIINYILFSKGEKKGIVVLMFLIALIFIFIGYKIEMKSIEETYQVIKIIYKDKIFFESNHNDEHKFDNIIKKPKIGNIQISTFIIFFVILLWRFYKTFPW